MGRQIIKQPNGLYAEFSSVTDSFVIWDATKDELLQVWKEEAIERVEESFKRVMERVEKNEKRNQFSMTWTEAVERHNQYCDQKIKIKS